MNNAELITALRHCGNFEDRDGCDEECPYFNDKDCPKRIMCDAADALEAAEQRIAELEAQLPKESEWIQMNGHKYCSRCGHKDSPILTHYCPYCGARMRGEHDE